MAYSTQSAVSDGTLSLLPLSIDYLDRADISVYIGRDLAPKSAWSWVGTTDHSIKFTPAIQAGVEVTVKRSTSVTRLYHNYSGGAQFTSTSLDDSLRQTLLVAQEFSEVASIASDELPLPVGPKAQAGKSNKYARADHVHVGGAGGGTVGTVVHDEMVGDGVRVSFNMENTPYSEDTTQVYVDSVYQEKDAYTLVGETITFDEPPADGSSIEVVTISLGGGKAIDIDFTNTPELPIADTGSNLQSLINWLGLRLKTVAQIGTAIGSSLVGFVQAGAGAVTRSVQDKLRERISVMDFGAVGDGASNDTNAFTAARVATGGRYHIPNGTYVVDAAPDVFADVFTAADNVTLKIGGVSYNVSNAFAGPWRYNLTSSVLLGIVHAKSNKTVIAYQDGQPGTATYLYRGLSIQTDSHFAQVGPATPGGSVDLLWQRSQTHSTDPAGNRFNETFDEANDRLIFSFATTASGAPNFDSYMRVYGGTSPKIEFPALAPCFRQGWTMQNRAETGYKLAWVVGADRHHVKDAAETFTHMTFKADGSVGFFGAGGITRPTITGSRGGNVALASLLTQLSLMGLIADGTSA